MHGKKYLAIFTVFFIIIYGLVKVVPLSRAASEDDQIPSDLSLDLDLAQKDPAPEQKQIVQSQTPQAKIVTDKGEEVSVAVKDEVPTEVKLQPAKDALNPEQTTSEQVVNKTVEGDKSESSPVASGNSSDSSGNNPASTPAGNVIPGTDIVEPDDNTAPTIPASSVNPSANPSEASQNPSTSAPSVSNIEDSVKPPSTPSPTDSTTPSSNSNTQQPVNTTNAIPPENGVAPPPAPAQGSSTENSAPKEQSQPSSNSESTPNQPPSGSNDSGGSSSGGSESSGGDSSAVQGVSAVSFWQIFVNQASLLFHNKISKIFKQ